MVQNIQLYGAGNTNTITSGKTNKTGGTAFSTKLKKAEEKQKSQTSSLDSIFEKASEKYNVPVKMLKAVAKAESNFDSKAVSSCGARGIMQLMPGTAAALGVKNSFDPEQNIMGGAKYLSQLMKKYDGNIKLTLAAYNAGSGNVAKYGGIPPFKETRNYVAKVTKYMGDNVSVPESTNKVNSTADSAKAPVQNVPEQKTDAVEEEFTYDDYMKLIQELQKQMNLLQQERFLNVIALSDNEEDTAW